METATCAYQSDYNDGGRDIVRRIEGLRRGELWVTHLSTIPASVSSDLDEIWWIKEQQFAMESEIATVKLIAQATDILMPKVFGYNTGMDGNPVRLPYMLMQCIEGNMVYDLGGPDMLTYGKKAKIRKSIFST